ncbi:MAG: ABC transporter substrate-binding protein [Planctomycetota bacterium JB042]
MDRDPRLPRRSFLALAALVAGALVGGCDRLGWFGESRLRIGVILPFRNDSQGLGANQCRRALETVLPPGGDGYEFVYRDDRNEPARTAELVRELVEREGVAAIIGGMTSPCALAGAERAETLGVPFLTPMATHDAITRGKEWAFRACFTDAQQGERMARFAWSELGVESVVVLRDVTNDYSLGLSDAFTETFLRLGGTVSATKTYRRGHDGGGNLVRWLRENAADAIYLPLYRGDITDIISKSTRLWQEREFVFLGGDGWHSAQMREFLQRAPALPSRIYITAHFAWDDPSEPVRELVEFWRRSAREETPTSAAAIGWDIGRLMRRVIESGARTREEVRDALSHEMERFDGATGSFRLDPERQVPTKDVHVLRWDDGTWVLSETR